MKLLMSVFIALNVWLYRVSGGRMMGRMDAAPILLLRRPGADHDASARYPLYIERTAAVS